MNGKKIIHKRMRQIVVLEQRPFTYADLTMFEIDGQVHTYKNGTIRNIFSQLRKEGKIERIGRSSPVLHTVVGFNFEKKKVTSDHTGVASNNVVQKYMKIFRIHELDNPAIHNIRLKFHSDKLAEILLINKSDLIYYVDTNQNKNMVLKDIFIGGILIKTTISNKGTVLVTIACSDNPIIFGIDGLYILTRGLSRIEYRLQYEVDKYYDHYYHCNDTTSGSCNLDSLSGDNRISIPPFGTWIVTMWHFAQDSKSLGIDGETFHITFEDSFGLFRVYSKKRKVRRRSSL
ncbi:MAG TPA: hypothetical protein VJR94_02735 [Candidatus Nitrosocosmicus sp.]|nr:hypothetical protein [Candidatus Nitrosocosmicus sp.]